jgi:hypothetical protein
MKNEDRFILLGSRLSQSPEQGRAFQRLLEKGLDWEYVFEKGSLHGVLPLIYEHSKGLSLPADVLSAFRAMELTNERKSRRQEKVLTGLLKEFNRREIPVVLLKAMALKGLYGSLTKRPARDIDLLVSLGQFKPADEVLRQAGFEVALGKGRKGDYLRKVYASNDYSHSLLQHFLYRHPGKDVLVELHWAFCGQRKSFKLDLDDFWSHTESVDFAGEKARTFSLERLLVQLSLHYTVNSSFCYRLKNLVDIAELVDRRRVDWQELFRIAEESRIKDHLYFTFKTAKEFLEAKVPDQFLARLKPNPFTRFFFSFLSSHYFGLDKIFPKSVVVQLQRFSRVWPFPLPF